MSLIAKTQIKEIIGDFSLSSDFIPALDQEVRQIVKKPILRAKKKNRRTVMARDI